jgi:hypothetical protein
MVVVFNPPWPYIFGSWEALSKLLSLSTLKTETGVIRKRPGNGCLEIFSRCTEPNTSANPHTVIMDDGIASF